MDGSTQHRGWRNATVVVTGIFLVLNLISIPLETTGRDVLFDLAIAALYAVGLYGALRNRDDLTEVLSPAAFASFWQIRLAGEGWAVAIVVGLICLIPAGVNYVRKGANKKHPIDPVPVHTAHPAFASNVGFVPAPVRQPVPPPPPSVEQRLAELKRLRDAGVIEEAEYLEKRRVILSQL